MSNHDGYYGPQPGPAFEEQAGGDNVLDLGSLPESVDEAGQGAGQGAGRGAGLGRLRNKILLGCAFVAVLAVVGFHLALMPYDTTAGTCDAWANCRAAAREQASWTFRPWATLATAGAAFTAWWACGWSVLVRNARLRGVLAALALIVLIPASIVSFFLAFVFLDCSDGAFVCGPEVAGFFAMPGIVGVVLTGVLIYGFQADNPATRARAVTVPLLIMSGTIPAFLVGGIIQTVLS